MHFLLENLNGFALISKNTNETMLTEEIILKSFYKYKTVKEMLKSTEKLIQGKFTKNLQNFLKNNLKKNDLLVVNDMKLKVSINQKLGKNFCKAITEKNNFREIKEYFTKLSFKENNNIVNIDKINLLLISHSIYSKKLKFAGSKLDTMIIYGIRTLEEIEKELNIYFSKLKEWYSWHFPELTNLVSDSLLFAKLINKFEIRKNLKTTDINDLIDKITGDKIKKSAETSIGSNFSKDDLESILCLTNQIISLDNFREIIKNYIKSRMYTIAPNLTATIGDRIGAKLIEHTGSLITLSKYPASTIQIFGAEKAMFRAKKERKATPKFGIIYNSAIINSASPKNKGKIGRMISAKVALSIRVDALGESKQGGILGLKNRIKVEQRLKQLESFLRKKN
jgi:nucleolar protein 58